MAHRVIQQLIGFEQFSESYLENAVKLAAGSVGSVFDLLATNVSPEIHR